MGLKIYVVGVGGVGGYFGGLLAKAGLDVTFFARGENFNALKENGLTVKSVAGDFEINPTKVIENINEIKVADLVLFTVKTYDTEAAAKELIKVVNKNTVIITFQNGVDNDLKIKKIIPNAEIYPGIAYVISARTKPGLIEQTGGLRKLTFGDRGNSNFEKLKHVENIIREAGIDVNLSDDITRDLWKKFLFICPFAGLTAKYRQTIGEIMTDLKKKKEYEDCLNEAIYVAKKLNVNLPDNIFDEVMKTTLNTAPASKSSLLIDIENGRKNEIETLNGSLVKMAKEVGVSLPVNEDIYNQVVNK